MAESQGISIVKSDDTSVMAKAILFDAADARITTGTATVRLYHILPTTGALEIYDFNDNDFNDNATATVTDTANMTQQAVTIAGPTTLDTGIWTYRFTQLVDLTLGDKYVFEVNHADLPRPISIEWQYGGHEGDTVEDIMEFDVTTASLAANTVAGILARLDLTGRTTGFVNIADILGVPDTAGATVPSEVWEELSASHVAVGTMGEIMDSISGGFGDVWEELAASHVTAGSFGAVLGALNLTGRSNTPTLDGLLGVPDTASSTIAETIWDEDITTHVADLDSAGAALHGLGHAIVNRSNNPTLNTLLAVPDSASATVAWTILDEVVDGSNHTTANSVGQRLTAVDVLTEAGGAGDLASNLVQTLKIDTNAVGATDPDSLAGKMDSVITTLSTADRQVVMAVNIQSDGLRIEAAITQQGEVLLTPFTRLQAQIFDEAGGVITGGTIGIGDFGSINARGFWGFTQATHGVVAGQVYQIKFIFDDGIVAETFTTTVPFVTIQG